VKLEAGMVLQPRLNLLACMHPKIVHHQVNLGDFCRNLAFKMVQEFDEFLLPFLLRGVRADLARARVVGGEQIQGSFAFILVFHAACSPGWAANVGDFRVRGCKLVFSSTHSTFSCGANFRVYSAQMFFTRRQNSASRGALDESHRCFRQGLSLWLARIRCTVCGEIESTTPSAFNCLANSAQSQCDSERPTLSGRSQAILTR